MVLNKVGGFLDKSIQNVDSLLKKIEQIEKTLGGADKVSQNMTKSQNAAYEKAKTNAELLLKTLKNVEATRSIISRRTKTINN